jgi:2-polyprenyl-6-methoxyphenol hydroxylase-like FAD-dependent oxidoreductase
VRIACVGGGPAGLYFALLMKLREPQHDVTVFERSTPSAARGWGVVFWDDLMQQLYSADPESAREIDQAAFRWNRQVVDVRGTQVVSPVGRGYGIRRQRLLDILVYRALGAGVKIEFDHEVTASSLLPEADLIVVCDGMNSRTRREIGGFQTKVQVGTNRCIWLGTYKVFDCFTFIFEQTDCGWMWAAANGTEAETSTFIIECSAETYTGLGFDTMSPKDCLALLEKIFERHLDGHRLIGQLGDGTDIQWLNFRTITNKRWHQGNMVLAGDAAHTTHFSVGSGTKLAIEDAIALARNLQRHDQMEAALEAYEKERQAAIFSDQVAARLSGQWLENVPRYMGLKPHQFTTLLRRRRSPLQPYLPPSLYYWLYPAQLEVPALRSLRRWAGPKIAKVHSRLR